MIKFFYAIKRFFIIGTGGYTRYSDYPGFYEEVEKQLKELRARRALEKKERVWGHDQTTHA